VQEHRPKLGNAAYNPPRDAFDLYTPRFTKGIGRTKVGVCPICAESAKRGGVGKILWLSMKFSAFKWSAHSRFVSYGALADLGAEHIYHLRSALAHPRPQLPHAIRSRYLACHRLAVLPSNRVSLHL
jgi:hypothetical protein